MLALPKSEPRQSRWHAALLLAALLAPLLGACATPPADPQARADYDARNDPAEPTNRTIFAVDDFVDRNAIKPVAQAYRYDVPVVMQNRLHDFLLNLHAPVIEINDILQGNFTRGWVTLRRFVVNTTVGGLGLFDVASDWDSPYHSKRITARRSPCGALARGLTWCCRFSARRMCATPSARGSTSSSIRSPGSAGPMRCTPRFSRAGTDGVDTRANTIDATDAIEKNSIDFDAAARSAYRQHRASVIAEAVGKTNGAQPGSVTLDEPSLIGP